MLQIADCSAWPWSCGTMGLAIIAFGVAWFFFLKEVTRRQGEKEKQ